MMKSIFKVCTPLLSLFVAIGCQQPTQEKLTPEEAKSIAKEAYIYGFPLAVNYKTLYGFVLNEKSPEYKGGFNNVVCQARVFSPADKTIVAPNSDTPYCMIWGDLRKEPMVITVPKMEENRLYQFQLIDLYTHNFAYISSIENGHEGGKYLIAGPDWKGEKPAGIDKVISCETPLFFSVIRTQLFNAEDLDNVKAIQAAYKVEYLSAFQGKEAPAIHPLSGYPDWKPGVLQSPEMFTYVNYMLSLAHPPASEKEMMDKFAKIGVSATKAFDISTLDTAIQKAIAAGVAEGAKELKAFADEHNKDPLFSADMFGTRASYQASAKKLGVADWYMLRATGAESGLYGNSAKEALYPRYIVDSDGNSLNTAEHNYTLTFEKDQFPPVNAFWSLTMYDAESQLLVDNPINRYLLNSTTMEDYVYGKDGSLTLYIQKDSPGKALENNWLPAPDGPFMSVLRLYGPKPAVISGEWAIPQIVKQ